MKTIDYEDKIHPFALIGLMAFLALIVFFPVFKADFFWDDKLAILERPAVLDPTGFLQVWIPFKNNEYWPISYDVFWLLWRIAPKSPFIFHTAVLVVHLLCSWMVWRVFRKLKIPLSYVGGLLFLVHPVNSETVSWVRQLQTTMSLLGGLSTLYFWIEFLEKRRRQDANKALICFLLGVLSKTTIITFPVGLALLTWYLGFFPTRNFQNSLILKKLMLFFGVAFFIGVLSALHNDFSNLPPEEAIRTDGFLSRLQLSGWALWFYLWKALYPADLSFMYPKWESHVMSFTSWLPLLSYTGIIIATWYFRTSQICRFFLISFCLYALALFPALGFVNIFFMRYSFVADHWQYQAIPVLIAGLCFAFDFLSRFSKIFTGGLLVAWLTAWGIESNHIATLFKTEETVYLDTLTKNPRAWMIYNNLGNIYSNRGQNDLALRYYQQSYELKPDHISAMNNAGKILIKIGKYDEAASVFQHAATLAPKNASVFTEWCAAYAFQEKYDLAEEKCKKAISLSENSLTEESLNAHLNLALIYRRTHQSFQAVAILRQASEHFPSSAILQKRLIAALVDTGDFKEMRILAEKYLDNNPQDREVSELLKKTSPPNRGKDF